ncbi:MAG: prepilin peptidase [Candidatus Woykebacteria bacterium]
MIFQTFLVFVLGLAIGSFLNVVAYRSVQGGSVFFARSKCPHCKVDLKSADLIPIVSFIQLKGKCRYCGEKISWQYPLVELTTGFLFAFTYIYWGNLAGFQFPETSVQYLFAGNWLLATSYFTYLLFVVGVLIVLFVTDIRDGLLPNSVILPSAALVGAYKLALLVFGYMVPQNLLLDLVVAFVAAAIFFAIVYISGEKAMGGGDVKLIFLIGLIVGWPVLLLSLFVGFLTGALVAVMLLLIGKKRFGETIPLGPFLTIGAFVSLFWGQEIIELYLRAIT